MKATNNQGKTVSAGVYLYKIQAGDFIDTKKMILLNRFIPSKTLMTFEGFFVCVQ